MKRYVVSIMYNWCHTLNELFILKTRTIVLVRVVWKVSLKLRENKSDTYYFYHPEIPDIPS
jgi:hypothetical protein